MSQHYNAIIEIKQTIEPGPMVDEKGYAVKNMGGPILTERRVVDRLRVVVSATSEVQAVRRAIRQLETHLDEMQLDTQLSQMQASDG